MSTSPFVADHAPQTNQGSRARLRPWEPGHRAADDRTRAHRCRDTTGTQIAAVSRKALETLAFPTGFGTGVAAVRAVLPLSPGQPSSG
jgi:hypothetical protein